MPQVSLDPIENLREVLVEPAPDDTRAVKNQTYWLSRIVLQLEDLKDVLDAILVEVSTPGPPP